MTLSACLIVRDGGRSLDECLSSIEGHVDEIVVLDTGSRDESLAIAAKHGARLFSFPWTGDFSAARNEALERATGDWILAIDADEILRPIPREEVRTLLSNPGIIACHTWLCPKAGWTAMRLMRLFRKHPWVRYRGAIHEDIGAGVQKRLAAGDGEIGQSGIVFDHRGFDGDQQAKHLRNIPLLLQELQRDPDQAWHRQHLAHCYYELGRKSEAQTLWGENVRRLRGKGKLSLLDSLSHVALIQLMLDQGRDVRSALEEAKASFPESPDLTWLQGRERMSRGRFEEAIPCFERLIRWGQSKDYDRSISYEDRIFDAYAYEALALCHFRLSRFQDAGRYFEIVRTYIPGSVEHKLKARLCAVLAEKRSGNPGGY